MQVLIGKQLSAAQAIFQIRRRVQTRTNHLYVCNPLLEVSGFSFQKAGGEGSFESVASFFNKNDLRIATRTYYKSFLCSFFLHLIRAYYKSSAFFIAI